MNPEAVAQASARLRRAKRALAELHGAASFNDAEDAWSDFLLACSTIYSKLEQGSKGNGKSEAWFGRKKKLRRCDPMLRYLHFARNSDEHGIERVTSQAPGNVWKGRKLEFNERIPLKAVQVDKVTLLPIRALPDAVVTGPTLKMVRAHDRRFGDYCDPPATHLGEPVPFGENFPANVAEVAVPYFEGLIEESRELISE